MKKTPQKNEKSIVKEEEVCVCFNVRKAARIITSLYDHKMRPLGYRATQITLLGVICRHTDMTVQVLADFMDTDRTTLTRNLKHLKGHGLIEMKKGSDRRERTVVLTAKGGQLLKKAYPVWKEAQDEIAASVGRGRLNKMMEDLTSVLDQVQRKAAS